jgi:hypothetical protein
MYPDVEFRPRFRMHGGLCTLTRKIQCSMILIDVFCFDFIKTYDRISTFPIWRSCKYFMMDYS